MARMVPAIADPDRLETTSEAERTVFRALQSQLPDDWIVLHGLWIGRSHRQKHAEADFVVIGDRAVLLLEVKGGTVARDDDGWHFTNRHGVHVDTRQRGPFDQARDVYYALRQHLIAIGKRDLFFDYVWGYGAIFPDCVLQITGSDPAVDPALYLDLSGFPEQLSDFLAGLADHWTERSGGDVGPGALNGPGRRGGGIQTAISPRVREELLRHLRPEFEPILGLATHARQAEVELLRLTEQQYQFLDLAAVNDRVILEGAAGTGKTVLAVEQARRVATEGARVLFTCFNRLLAENLREQFGESGSIDFYNWHGLVWALRERAGMQTERPSDWREFNRQVLDYIVPALDVLGDDALYDYLVIDEGQDLMNEGFLEVLDLLVDGGLRGGRWLISLDPQQAIFLDQFEPDTLQGLLASAARVPLRTNCRNTRQIAEYISEVAGVGSSDVRGGANGPAVEVDYFGGDADYLRLLRRTVNKLVTEFRKVGMGPEDIVVLSTRTSYVSDVVGTEDFFIAPAVDLREVGANRAGRIGVGTVQQFKGLEAAAVVLVGAGSLERELDRRLFYVGGSRARLVLRVLLPESVRVEAS